MNIDIFTGNKVRILSEKHKQIFTVNMVKGNRKWSIPKMLELSEIKMHNGFEGIVSEVENVDSVTFEKIRKEEMRADVLFFLINSKSQKMLKVRGVTFWSE